MHTRYILSSFLISLTLINACSDGTKFDSEVPNAKPAVKDAAADAKPDPVPPAEPVVVPPEAPSEVAIAATDVELPSGLSVAVQLSSPSVRSGSKKIQATAVVAGTSDKAVVWSVVGPAGAPAASLGSIDAAGVYTSPASDTVNIAVAIIATLVQEASVSGKAPLQLVPAAQIFVGCKKSDTVFPITGEIFDNLSRDIKTMPDYTKLVKNETVCLDQYNIPRQQGVVGFLGQATRTEWFGFHSVATLVIPKDGMYTFELDSDDGSHLFIDGESIIANLGQHSMHKMVSQPKFFTAGKHKMVLDWFQGPIGFLGLVFSWKTPDMASTDAFKVVPTSAFAAYVSAE